MTLDLDRQLAALRQMTIGQLRARYAQLTGEPSRARHKEQLLRRIAWRLQALAEGDLSERARRRAAELARDADLRLGHPRHAPLGAVPLVRTKTQPVAGHSRDARLPTPGTILVRRYRGRTLQVLVLQQGFEYDGARYTSLTAVVRQITGKHWNGFHFFGLKKRAQPA